MINVETTRYGQGALEALTAVVADVKRDDPMTPVTIVAPNNIAGIVARRHLASGLGPGSSGIAAVEITTLPRLAERMAAHTLAPRRPATRTITSAAWRRELSSDAGVFAPVAGHPSTARALADAHTELRDLSDDALATLAPATSLSADLVTLHQRVKHHLADRWYDETDLLQAGARAARATAHSVPTVLYLPQALTLAEAAFARALSDAGPLSVIAALTGVRRADDAVRRSLRRIGCEAGTIDTIATATRIINASDSDDEVRCVVREVVAKLQMRPGHRIAVLYGSRAPYARLLHEHLSAAGITVNGPAVRAVDERAVARTMLETLALADSDVPRADLFRALANVPARDFGGTRIPLSRWERISRSAGVVRGADWEVRLQSFIQQKLGEADREVEDAERLWLADRHRADAAAGGELRDFTATLRQAFSTASSLRSWAELGQWALDLFATLVGNGDPATMPPEEQYAVVTVRSVLGSLHELDSVGGPASLGALREILELELASSLPRVGKLGHGVLVAPIAGTVGLDVDLIHLVGLSEDAYPGRLRDDALLPESARASVPDQLASARESLHMRHRNLLAAMASAPEVVASFPRGDLRRSSERLPSRWLLPSLRALSGDMRLPATEWEEPDYGSTLRSSSSFASELLAAPSPATDQEWRTRAALSATLDDGVVTSARELLDARRSPDLTRFDGNLGGIEGLPNYAAGHKLVSPTALESYASCPHAFFVKRLLGVEPLEQPEDSVTISPADIGNLVHECFDELVTEFDGRLPGAGDPWSLEHRTRLVDIADAKSREFEGRGLTGHPTLWARERTRVLSDLISMLDVDDRWRAETGTAVKASELAFGHGGTPPVEIIVPSGRVLMRGSADKVDVATDGTLYVTDIKTGSRRTFKDIAQDDPVLGGTKLQLPVYAYAARETFGDRATPVVTAYWFVRKDAGRVEITLTPEVESRYAHALDVIVRSIASGLFPAKAPETADFSWVQCSFCNPDGVGHSDVRERWELKRADPVLRELVDLVEAPATVAEEGP